AGVFLALLGFGKFSGLTANSVPAQHRPTLIDVPGLPPGLDCATIHEKGIDRQENLLAGSIMIACGEAQGGSSFYGPFSQLLYDRVTAPLAYGGAEIDLVTGAVSFCHPTQSETYTLVNPDNANLIAVAYNVSGTASADSSCASFSC